MSDIRLKIAMEYKLRWRHEIRMFVEFQFTIKQKMRCSANWQTFNSIHAVYFVKMQSFEMKTKKKPTRNTSWKITSIIIYDNLSATCVPCADQLNYISTSASYAPCDWPALCACAAALQRIQTINRYLKFERIAVDSVCRCLILCAICLCAALVRAHVCVQSARPDSKSFKRDGYLQIIYVHM